MVHNLDPSGLKGTLMSIIFGFLSIQGLNSKSKRLFVEVINIQVSVV